MSIDISDLDLPSLIQELWLNMTPAAFFETHSISPPSQPSLYDISLALSKSKYIDYLAGRCIKTDFSDLTNVYTFMYNRGSGPNAFENIVAKLRS